MTMTQEEIQKVVDALGEFIAEEETLKDEGKVQVVRDLKHKAQMDTFKLLTDISRTMEMVISCGEYPVGTTAHIGLGLGAAVSGLVVAASIAGLTDMKLMGATKEEATKAGPKGAMTDKTVAHVMTMLLTQFMTDNPGAERFSARRIPNAQYLLIMQELDKAIVTVMTKLRAAQTLPA